MDIGIGIVGWEVTITNEGYLQVASEGFDFTAGMTISEFESTGTFIRGSGYDYTLYSTGKNTCTEGGSHYTVYSVGIEAGSVDPLTGDLINVRGFGLTVIPAIRWR